MNSRDCCIVLRFVVIHPRLCQRKGGVAILDNIIDWVTWCHVQPLLICTAFFAGFCWALVSVGPCPLFYSYRRSQFIVTVLQGGIEICGTLVSLRFLCACGGKVVSEAQDGCITLLCSHGSHSSLLLSALFQSSLYLSPSEQPDGPSRYASLSFIYLIFSNSFFHFAERCLLDIHICSSCFKSSATLYLSHLVCTEYMNSTYNNGVCIGVLNILYTSYCSQILSSSVTHAVVHMAHL